MYVVARVVPLAWVVQSLTICRITYLPQVFCCLQGSVSVTVHRTRFAIGP